MNAVALFFFLRIQPRGPQRHSSQKMTGPAITNRDERPARTYAMNASLGPRMQLRGPGSFCSTMRVETGIPATPAPIPPVPGDARTHHVGQKCNAQPIAQAASRCSQNVIGCQNSGALMTFVPLQHRTAAPHVRRPTLPHVSPQERYPSTSRTGDSCPFSFGVRVRVHVRELAPRCPKDQPRASVHHSHLPPRRWLLLPSCPESPGSRAALGVRQLDRSLPSSHCLARSLPPRVSIGKYGSTSSRPPLRNYRNPPAGIRVTPSPRRWASLCAERRPGRPARSNL